MSIDSPDYTQWVQRVEVVGSTPTAELSTTEVPISRLETLPTSSQVDGTVLQYTVPAATITVLYGVELFTTDFDKTIWSLTIGGVAQWSDKYLPAGLNIFFSDARLKTGDVILVEARSSDGTAVTAYAHLEGKEIS